MSVENVSQNDSAQICNFSIMEYMAFHYKSFGLQMDFVKTYKIFRE